MVKRIAVLAVAIAMVAPQAFADNEGFATGSCELPAGAPTPGSGTPTHVGPAPYYPYVDGNGDPLKTPLQAAIDTASPGDHIILRAGVYRESVSVPVTRPYLRFTGESRTGVVFDGGTTRNIGWNILADGVVVENMTGHSYRRHAFFWTELTGYWARYITAYNNGLYGIYAFDARCGEISHSYGSGNADSAFYVGECFPCDAVIHHIVAEENALGYSGTNAGGDLVLRDSIWRNNAMGIVPNTLDGEDRPPQRGVTIKHNQILNNNNTRAPGVNLAGTFWGVGIAIAGGNNNQVYGNTVTNHGLAGIVLSPLPDDNLWIPSGNTVWGNTVTHDDAQWPDSMDLAQGALSGAGNCWADNTFSTSQPPLIEDIYNCGFTTTPAGGSPQVEIGLAQGAAGLNGRDQQPWQTWPAPTASEASIEMPLSLKGAIAEWLPALF